MRSVVLMPFGFLLLTLLFEGLLKLLKFLTELALIHLVRSSAYKATSSPSSR